MIGFKTRAEIELMADSQLVSWFMMASYAYYSLGKPVMEDSSFDYLVQRLKECYDDVEHIHKKYITKEHLDAGTGYDIHYPLMVKGATMHYLKESGLWNLYLDQ